MSQRPPGDEPLAPLPTTRTNVEPALYLAPGTRLADRYRVEDIQGIGGMGVVYRAWDEQLATPVAVKILRPERAADPRFYERFRREIILGRQVSHRNVVRIHDIGRDGPHLFLTMDLVEGRSLRQLLGEEGPLPLARALPLLRQLAEALACAHQEGVVHRDLKPENVLVDEHDQLYVSDFGIARSLGGLQLTATGMVVGTPQYVSPEQARGEEVDGRSDLYSLGLIAFEALSGRLPFRGDTESEMLAQRLTGSTDFAALQGKVPPGIVAVLRKLLARDPRQRYASAEELLADLAAGEPRSRRPWLTWVAAGALVALGAALAWVLATRGPGGAVAGATLGASASAPQHEVAVLPLLDRSGRVELAWASRGLAELLAAELSESPDLRVLDSLRVFRALEDLGFGPAASNAELRTLARLLDVDRLVLGTLRPAGEGVELSLRLAAADLPELPAQELPPVAAAPEKLVEVVRLQAAALRAALAAAPGEASLRLTQLPAALAAYGSGLDRLVTGDALAAVPSLEEATGLDPGFTAAWVRLAEAYDALGRRSEAVVAAKQAVATIEDPRSRSALEARARLALLEGDADDAQALLRSLASRFPNDVETRVGLARALGESGRLEEAARELGGVVEVDPRHPLAWYLLAKYTIQSGDSRKALDEYLVHALVIQNKLGNEQGRADVLNAMGVAYEDLGQVDQAVDHYGRAAEIRERIGDRRGVATSLRNLAALHAMRGDHGTARSELERARTLLDELGDHRGLADLVNDLGLLAEGQGRQRQALDHYRESLAMRRDLGDRRATAESLNNVGFAYYLLGEYDNASVYWGQALELFTADGNREGVVLARQNLGLLQLARGEWRGAMQSLVAALEESRQLALPDATAVSLGYIGRLSHLAGRFDAALASYGQALELLADMQDRRGMVEFTLLEAETLLELGAADAAAERLKRAGEWLAEGENREQRARLRTLAGYLALRRGDPAAAQREFAAAGRQAAASESAVARLEAELGAALGVLAAGRAAAAADRLGAVAANARRLGHLDLRLRALEGLARSELARGERRAAAETAASALAATPRGEPYGGSWRLHLLRAQALGAAGDGSAAAAALAAAAAELERLRGQLPAEHAATFDHLPEVQEVIRAEAAVA
ncbi:MAG TPA: tetratricopeptide repeat protein [Thermoanaerobaculia bacterium]|nr:tetratricopeptide repeat protein [Thermoanaerobaculia bacterium]